jgi:hypothetical protein
LRGSLPKFAIAEHMCRPAFPNQLFICHFAKACSIGIEIFYARAHKYGSSLDASLGDANIPTSVLCETSGGSKPQLAHVSSVLAALSGHFLSKK